MLNINEVLSYIKDNLGFPFVQIELTDEKIIEYVTDHTRREFSYYIPNVAKTIIHLDSEAQKVPGSANEWYLFDPQGLEILNVKEFYTSASDLYLHGHPPMGPLSYGELKEFALAVEMAGTLKMFSSFDYTCEFRHPNILRISPHPTSSIGTITVEYERQQPKDLSGIPNDLHLDFKKLALADIMIVLGRIRKKYGNNMRTPFGEIPLDESVGDEGKDMKNTIVEKLERTFIPNVIIDHG